MRQKRVHILMRAGSIDKSSFFLTLSIYMFLFNRQILTVCFKLLIKKISNISGFAGLPYHPYHIFNSKDQHHFFQQRCLQTKQTLLSENTTYNMIPSQLADKAQCVIDYSLCNACCTLH